MKDESLYSRIKDASHTFEYNPKKFWEENTLQSIFEDLHKQHEAELKRKIETNWKPEYFISIGEAKTANLKYLIWLCNNYRVISGSKAINTIRQRQIIINHERTSKGSF